MASKHRDGGLFAIVLTLLSYSLSLIPITFTHASSIIEPSSDFNLDAIGPHSHLLAYGDFNSDKHTDLFVLNTLNSTLTPPSSTIEVWLWSIEHTSFLPSSISVEVTRPVANVVAGDFNYDGKLDLLVTGPDTDSWSRPIHWMCIYLGGHTRFYPNPIDLPDSIEQVLVTDVNNDLRLDLFGSRWKVTAPPKQEKHSERYREMETELDTESVSSSSDQSQLSQNNRGRKLRPSSLKSEPNIPIAESMDSKTIPSKSISGRQLLQEGGSSIENDEEDDRTSTVRTYWIGSSPPVTLDADENPPIPSFQLIAQDLSFPPTSQTFPVSDSLGYKGGPLAELATPHSHANVDLNGDCMADLVVTSVGTINVDGNYVEHKFIEIWLNQPATGPIFHSASILPKGSGQLSFADVDQDGNIDIVVPIFTPANTGNEIRIYYNRASQLCESRYDGHPSPHSPTGSSCRPLANLCEPDPYFWFDFMAYTSTSESASKQSEDTVIYQFPSQSTGIGHMYTEAWTMPPDRQNPATKVPFTLRLGDANLDGYPDLLLAMTPTPPAAKEYAVVELWLNEPCQSNDGANGDDGSSIDSLHCSPGAAALGRRIFSSTSADDVNNELASVRGTFAGASFIDLSDDGMMDVLMSAYYDGKYTTYAYKNRMDQDAYFLTAMSSNGVCPAWCPSPQTKFPEPKPYGVNQPGATFKFAYTDLDGDGHMAIGVQLPQSAYMPLATPYVTFGLGRTNTFIDTFFFGIGLNQSIHSRSWVSIVPNAQIIIFPYPPSDPDEWTLELFVSPTSHLFWVGISWAAVLTLLAVVIAYLHIKEKREDEKEKRKHQLLFTF